MIGVSETDRARSLAMARDLIDGTEAEQLAGAAIGQFDPAGAGGPGSSRFGAAESLVNPWGYVLFVEGALLFAASATRRNQHAAGRAAMPFTVSGFPGRIGQRRGGRGIARRGLDAGVDAGIHAGGDPADVRRGAASSWRGRPARRAVRLLRGDPHPRRRPGASIEFTRYGLQRRNGLAFAAVPLARVDVREHAEVRLAAEVEDWAGRFGGSDASAAVGQAVRRFRGGAPGVRA